MLPLDRRSRRIVSFGAWVMVTMVGSTAHATLEGLGIANKCGYVQEDLICGSFVHFLSYISNNTGQFGRQNAMIIKGIHQK
eukprot:4834950-Amphidinium_carterae.1